MFSAASGLPSGGPIASGEQTIHHPRGTGKTCCFALHSPVAYSQAHRNPQHWLALPSGSNAAPAHHSGTDVQLNSEPRMPAGQAFPLARDVLLVVPIGCRCSDVAAAALRTVHGLVIVGCTPSLAYGELWRLDGGGPLHRAKIRDRKTSPQPARKRRRGRICRSSAETVLLPAAAAPTGRQRNRSA